MTFYHDFARKGTRKSAEASPSYIFVVQHADLPRMWHRCVCSTEKDEKTQYPQIPTQITTLYKLSIYRNIYKAINKIYLYSVMR
jgi:hypothetical protein